MATHLLSCLLLFAGALNTAPPTQADAQAMAERMADYAERYVQSLPNFLCIRVDEQFQSGAKHEHWKRGDTWSEQLSFNNGDEKRSLLAVNNKAAGPGMRIRARPLRTEGEFGNMLVNVFRTADAFTWDHWEEIASRRVAVFRYEVDKERSALTFSGLGSATIPYHGYVFADPESGTVWRVTDEADQIPLQLGSRSIATTINYGDVSIGGKRYVLPVQATVRLVNFTGLIRDEITYRDYRKFSSESVIHFGDEPARSDHP